MEARSDAGVSAAPPRTTRSATRLRAILWLGAGALALSQSRKRTQRVWLLISWPNRLGFGGRQRASVWNLCPATQPTHAKTEPPQPLSCFDAAARREARATCRRERSFERARPTHGRSSRLERAALSLSLSRGRRRSRQFERAMEGVVRLTVRASVRPFVRATVRPSDRPSVRADSGAQDRPRQRECVRVSQPSPSQSIITASSSIESVPHTLHIASS